MRQLNFPPPTFPILETPTLRLRELVEADKDGIFRLFSNQEVTRYYDFDAFNHRGQSTGLIARQSRRLARGEAIRWGITQRSNDLVIGTVGLVIDRTNESGGLGYDLARPYWRMGIMYQALTIVIRYAFSSVNLNRLQALVMPENIASLKLLEKLNFQEEGLLRQYLFFKGRYQDMVCLSLLRTDLGLK